MFCIFVFRTVSYPPILVTLLIGLSLTWLYYNDVHTRIMNQALNSSAHLQEYSGLILKDVYLEGKKHTNDQDILDAIGHDIGDPMVHIDIASIKSRLEQLPWVKYTVVERLYPSTLSIRFIERTPAALWQYQNKVHLVDTSGVIIEGARLEHYSDLIIIVGKDAPSHVDRLMSMIHKNPSIFKQISSAIRISERRWNIRLHNGLEIKLPEKNPEVVWEKLIEQESEVNILEAGHKVIDLRIPDKLFITLR